MERSKFYITKKEILNWCRPWHQGLCVNDYTSTELSKSKLKTVNSRIKNVANIVKKCLPNFFLFKVNSPKKATKDSWHCCQLQGKITPVKNDENKILLPKSMTKLSIEGMPKGCKSILVENMSFCSDNGVFGMP